LLVVRVESEYPSGYPLLIKASPTCSSTSVLSLANVHKHFAVRCNVQQPYGQWGGRIGSQGTCQYVLLSCRLCICHEVVSLVQPLPCVVNMPCTWHSNNLDTINGGFFLFWCSFNNGSYMAMSMKESSFVMFSLTVKLDNR